jgi:mono/diheme cytochrome c family protein
VAKLGRLGRLGIVSGVVLAAGIAATVQAEDGEKMLPPPMTAEMLGDPARIAVGEAIWHEQCTHCHGAKAYPGKAPKLRPARYKPEFVFHRVANGFKGMPAWRELYSEDELIGIVAYVKSKEFSP